MTAQLEQLRVDMLHYERPFVMQHDQVDLLAMAQRLSPETFREYVRLAREWRRIKNEWRTRQ